MDKVANWVRGATLLKCARRNSGLYVYLDGGAPLGERDEVQEFLNPIMGSIADRVSYEATQYEQGLLTYALLKGMKGAALREQEFIDVSTLFNNAVEEVPRLAQNIGGIQSPRIAAPKGTNFNIGQLTAEDRQKIPLASAKPFLLAPVLLSLSEGFDNLGLTALVRKKLRDDSYASGRGGARRLPVVYVDAEQFAGPSCRAGLTALPAIRCRRPWSW